jgi:adenosylmethionine-8-amino-7-oxononanoate aminotransferase
MTSAYNPVWHPFTQHGLGEPIPMVERAEGASLYTSDGRRIIDAISSWWVITHGHRDPAIMEAVKAQADKLDQMIFAGWTHPPAQELAQGLTEWLPFDLPYAFYSDSGSTAVEVGLKMALGYWANRGEPRGTIAVLEHSYHGDTIGAMSVGARGVFNQAYAPLLFDVATVPFPAEGAEQASLDALESICRDSQTAAFIVEPLILGAGGMLVYSPDILAQMAAICARFNVLLIADEVMTGWGRTGTAFACEQAGVSPDILCLAKGLTGGSVPLAVTMASAPIYDAHLSEDRAKIFYHSSSFTANPLSCAAALANLKIWREGDTIEGDTMTRRLDDLCERQAQGLAKLTKTPGIAGGRQCGTMIAVDYEVPDGAGYLSNLAPQLLAFFRERDLLVRPLGNTAYVMPPYCIDDADLTRVHDAMADATSLLR